MQADFGGGLALYLFLQDKERLKREREVSCFFENIPSSEVKLYIQDEMPQRFGCEDDGFRVEGFLPHIRVGEGTRMEFLVYSRYEIHLHIGLFLYLINEEVPPREYRGNSIMTRTNYDRLDIFYEDRPWGLCKEKE